MSRGANGWKYAARKKRHPPSWIAFCLSSIRAHISLKLIFVQRMVAKRQIVVKFVEAETKRVPILGLTPRGSLVLSPCISI